MRSTSSTRVSRSRRSRRRWSATSFSPPRAPRNSALSIRSSRSDLRRWKRPDHSAVTHTVPSRLPGRVITCRTAPLPRAPLASRAKTPVGQGGRGGGWATCSCPALAGGGGGGGRQGAQREPASQKQGANAGRELRRLGQRAYRKRGFVNH